jgi:Predicted membrane protein
MIIGIGIYSIGIIGEAIADFQLHRFKKTTSGICTSGLWKYSRHPNYFFEFLVWLGISLLFIGNAAFFISLIGPLCVFIILFYITGPYTERCSIERHGDAYKQYQNTTSYFFPKRPIQ